MASKKTTKTTDRSQVRAREERRASELAALSRAAAAYSKALDVVSESVSSLTRSAAAIDIARASSISPDLIRYGLVARLRPSDMQRAVRAIVRDLSSKLAFARSSDLIVPDGTEEAYGLLVSRLADASDLITRALEDFGRAVPRSSAKPHPMIRDLILSATRGATFLNRLVGRGRATSSVHVSAVRDEIVSEKDVSFY